MTKHVLIAAAVGFAFSAAAQDRTVSTLQQENAKFIKESTTVVPGPVKPVERKARPGNPGVASAPVCVTQIGGSGNAYTCAFGARMNLCVDPSLNTIVFIHRSDPNTTTSATTGDYRYDISTDGGLTWSNDIGPVYNGDLNAGGHSAGRYPQGAIYNPSGNTTPGNAYVTCNGPTLTGTNGASWGGSANAAYKLDQSAMAYSTEDTVPFIVSGDNATVTQQGTYWAVDTEYDFPNTVYTGGLIVTKGTWNVDHYDLTRTVINIPNTGEIAFASIAFGTGGQVGYISVLCHPDYMSHPDSVYVPYIWKTTDGGNNWNPLGSVSMNNLSADLNNLMPVSTSFQMDSEVDANDNLHMVFMANYSPSPFSVSTVLSEFNVYDVYTTDGGTTWYGLNMGTPVFYGGTYDPNGSSWLETTRPQITRTWAGDKIFVAYIDTDSLIGVENIFPDLFVTGLDVNSGMMTSTLNLTVGTAADAQMTMANVGNYVLGTSGTYTIPATFQFIADPTQVANPTQHNYVCSLEVNDAQFTMTASPILLTFVPVGIDEASADISLVSVNAPNPFTDETRIEVSLLVPENVVIEITNMAGQLVREIDAGRLSAGKHAITIERGELGSGTYLYTVKAGRHSITDKMIVQ